MTQEPGTFIVTFPKAYHAGFSYGVSHMHSQYLQTVQFSHLHNQFNCGEAVNFASYDWLKAGSEAIDRYRSFSRDSVFSHTRLIFTLWENRSGLSEQHRRE